MPKRAREFIKGEFYHIVLRRIKDELLFVDVDDYYRGIFSLYEFNNEKSVTIREKRRIRQRFKETIQRIEKGEIPIKVFDLEGKSNMRIDKDAMVDKRELIVKLLAFCLMPNHIHLLVQEIKEGGISKFMQKLGSGLAGYFKRKYGIKLKGHFFQDRFSAIHIKTEEQLKVVFVYIHTNPLSLIEPNWKEKGIGDLKKAINFVENYKWSSYQDYLGKKNFPSVTQRDFILEIMGGEKNCKSWVDAWIKQKGEIKKIIEKYNQLALE